MNSIIYEKRTYSNVKNTHSHDYFQLLLPLQGSMHIETEKMKTILKPDHLFFLTPSSTHTFYADDRNEIFVLDIPKSRIPVKFQGYRLNDQYLPINKKWESIRFLLLDEMKGNDSSDYRVERLIQYASDFLFPKSHEYESLNYIHQYYCDKIELTELAEIENFHPSYYSEWFKDKFGMLPSKYIQQLRLSKAKTLLKETDFSILEIAVEVGYNHASSLNRLFINHFNMTPKEYRQKHKNG